MVFKSKQQVDNSRNNIKINFIEPNTKVIGEIHSESDFRAMEILKEQCKRLVELW